MSIRNEPRETVVSGPVPAETATGAALVEAAKAGIEYRPNTNGKTWSLLRKENKLLLRINSPAENWPQLDEMLGIMNLSPGPHSYDVAVAPGYVPDPLTDPRPRTNELRITPRSTIQVFFYLSNGIEVPCEHLEQGLVRPTRDAEGKPLDSRELTRGLFEVHCCKGLKPPPMAYLAVKSRGHWFYIDDRDQASKSTLSLALALGRLDFGGQKATGPILTLPVGR